MKAALILAGGKAARFGGKEKAFLLLKGIPLVQWVIQSVRQCADQVILSGSCTLEEFGLPVVKDNPSHTGPLAGFHAGFSSITAEYTFVTGCDMPFLNPGVIDFLFENAVSYSCCLPKQNTYVEPLCCVYHTEKVRTCLNSVMLQGKRRVSDLISCLPHPRFVSYQKIREIDPHLLSFKNINTQEDLEEARACVEEFDE